MRRLIHIGCMLAAIGCLAIALSCGLGAAVVQQRAVVLPRMNLQIGNYRVSTYTARMSLPPKYFYIVWVFVRTYPPEGRGPPTEKGEQFLQVPLRSD